MNDKLQILILHSLELRVLRKRLGHLFHQRQIGCFRKKAFLVDYRVHANRLLHSHQDGGIYLSNTQFNNVKHSLE